MHFRRGWMLQNKTCRAGEEEIFKINDTKRILSTIIRFFNIQGTRFSIQNMKAKCKQSHLLSKLGNCSGGLHLLNSEA